MKKRFLFSALMASSLLLASCGGAKEGDASTSATDAAASTSTEAPANMSTAAKRMNDIFGGNLFWGVTKQSTEAEVKSLKVEGAQTNHDDISYQWSRDFSDGASFTFDVTFEKGKFDSYSFLYEGGSRSEATEFGKELLAALEAKNGKHTNDDAAETGTYDWDDDNYLIYMMMPDPEDKSDKMVNYTFSKFSE
jgi:hypothetical protein